MEIGHEGMDPERDSEIRGSVSAIRAEPRFFFSRRGRD